jgi:hypothetical protein
MNIHRALLLAALLGCCMPLSAAVDVAGLQAEIDAKTAEITELREDLAQQEAASERLETALDELKQNADELAQRKAETLAALRAQFERVVADPSLDITAAQRAYGEAFGALQAHVDAVADQEQQIAEGRQRIASTRDTAARAGEALAELRARLDRARAERLLAELNVVGEITLSNTITCKREETIAECIARGEEAARGLARERFARQLLASVTEAQLVAQHSEGAGTQPTLIDSTVLNSGFRGQGDYAVELSARLRNETNQTQACALLGLTPAQCSGTAPSPTDTASAAEDTAGAQEDAVAPPEEPPSVPPAEPAVSGNEQFRLTVRSNVYYDEVFINGTAYGSTKLDVMLPAGEYDVEVRKPGHTSYQQRISLSANRTVTAELAELAE